MARRRCARPVRRRRSRFGIGAPGHESRTAVPGGQSRKIFRLPCRDLHRPPEGAPGSRGVALGDIAEDHRGSRPWRSCRSSAATAGRRCSATTGRPRVSSKRLVVRRQLVDPVEDQRQVFVNAQGLGIRHVPTLCGGRPSRSVTGISTSSMSGVARCRTSSLSRTRWRCPQSVRTQPRTRSDHARPTASPNRPP